MMMEDCEHACNHKSMVVEDSMIFCTSCGEEIHRIISTGKDKLAQARRYPKIYIYISSSMIELKDSLDS